MKLLDRLLARLPLRSQRDVDSAFNDGFMAGAISAGFTRDYRGRFKSLKPSSKKRPKLSSVSQLFPPSDV